MFVIGRFFGVMGEILPRQDVLFSYPRIGDAFHRLTAVGRLLL